MSSRPTLGQGALRNEREERFTVDAALLKELGERLVGAPHIALAELVKNSYDADATQVIIRLGEDSITVLDNGQGMAFDEFRGRWMRVGSPHKQTELVSRRLGRALTGSKGVGRLAVQFLGDQLRLRTTSENSPERELSAWIDWRQAVTANELTSATARYRVTKPTSEYPGSVRFGTEITITGLKHAWEPRDFRDLAREVWFLRPPFTAFGEPRRRDEDFEVAIEGGSARERDEFGAQLTRVLDLWMARIVGKLSVKKREGRRVGIVALRVQFSEDQSSIEEQYEVPPADLPSWIASDETEETEDLGENCLLSEAAFEIRVFDLRGKQRFGVNVAQARQYMTKYGGVHVYDGGFRIPFSGPEADWLRIEIDHAHRLSRSRLLPDELVGDDEYEALTHLPTNSRLFGVVRINTSKESERAREAAASAGGKVPDHLQIQVSRDRLVRNTAFFQLRYVARWAVDRYALERSRRRWDEIEELRNVRAPFAASQTALELLDAHEGDIPAPVYKELRRAVEDAGSAAKIQAEGQQAITGQLASFASAGMIALAYDHEVSKQIEGVRRVARRLKRIDVPKSARLALEPEIAELESWVKRAEGIRGMMAHLASPESRTSTRRFLLREITPEAVRGVRYLLRGASVVVEGIPTSFRLPRASYAAWISVFQNVFVNSANAIDAAGIADGRVEVTCGQSAHRRYVHIQDNGAGVHLKNAEQLFEPFVRDLEISDSRRKLAAGGTGLGLALVRLVVRDAGAEVRFVEPDSDYTTCLEMYWDE